MALLPLHAVSAHATGASSLSRRRGAERSLARRPRFRDRARVSLLAALAFAGIASFAASPYQPVPVDPLLEPWRWRMFPELSGLGAHCIAEDRDGKIWFGGNDGVRSFDGIDWEHHPPESVMVGGVNTIFPAPDGTLYVGGRAGISRQSNGQWSGLFPGTGGPFGEVRKLIVASDGSLWAATTWGILRFHRDRWDCYTDASTAQRISQDSRLSFLNVELLPESIATKSRPRVPQPNRRDFSEVAEDASGRVWIGAGAGEIITFDPTSGAWALFNESDGLVCGRNPSILPLRDGSVWVVYSGGSGHLNKFEDGAWQPFRLDDAGVPGDASNLIQTRDGTVWLSGRYVVSAFRDGRWRNYQQPEAPIPTARNFLLQSSDGALWIGGSGTEIQRVDYETPRWLTLLDLNFQWESPAGVAWFLHRDGRVVVQEGEAWTAFGPEDGAIDTPVALVGARNGEVWVAGSHQETAATARFDGQQWTRYVHDEFSWGIDWHGVLATADGSVWFSAAVDSSGPKEHRHGLLQFREGAWLHHHQPGRAMTGGNDEDPATLLPATQRPEPIGKFLSLGESPGGRIWAGRNILIFQDDGAWSHFTPTPETQYGIIEMMFTASDGDLWIGTRQFGALRFDGQSWQHFQGKGSLVANSVRGIAETSDGSIWTATDRDISRFDGHTWMANLLPEAMNVPHDGGSLKSGPSGALWINRFPPDWTRRAWSKATPPDPAAPFWTIRHHFRGTPPQTTIAAASETVSQPGNISLFWNGTSPWREAKDTRLQYSYRLDSQPWSPFTSDRGVALFSLPSGHHRFEVRARDQDFNVDPTPAALEFEVLPPAWRQTWFIALMIALGGLIATQSVRVFLERGRLRQTNRALAAEIEARRQLNASLEQRVHERTEALARSEQSYRLLFDTMRQGVVHQDTSGRILFMNPAAERILGKRRETLLGQGPESVERDTFLEDGTPFPVHEQPSLVALQTGLEVRDVVMGVRHPDSPELRWINITATPLFHLGETTPYEVYTIFDDITERRQADLQVRHLNAQLADRARSLEEANRELEAFSYSVSHDLRAPLRHVDGYIDLLVTRCREGLNADCQRYLDTIASSANRMGVLIDELLRFSRTSRAELKLRDLDMNEIIRGALEELEESCAGRSIEWAIGDLPPARGDHSLIRQVWLNLIGNAIKYTRPRETARIEIASREENGELVYMVSDNGAGFDMSYADKLFGVFQRLHSRDDFEGTGIGLALVHRIITRHGGRIWAEAEIDKGATFHFTLPRIERG